LLNDATEFAGITDPAIHSVIQDNQAALQCTQLALKLLQKNISDGSIHLSTAEEADFLRQDKPEGHGGKLRLSILLLNAVSFYENFWVATPDELRLFQCLTTMKSCGRHFGMDD
jgi:dihydroorotase-like cyclic amidohydrolase